jgi:pimeloyl-ACP methyl ester carboxylesterase
VADAAALLDRLHLNGCVLIAHSMGSCIVRELAHRRPDLMESGVMVATLPRHPGWLEVFHRGMVELFESGADVAVELLLGTLFDQLYNPGESA